MSFQYSDVARKRFLARGTVVGVVLALSFCFLLPAWANNGRLGGAPPPTLIQPGDNTDITGQDALEFRWSNEGGNFDHYDFKLYKGPQTVESGMILHQNLPAGSDSFPVKASMFEAGQTYAWSLRRVGNNKSRTAFSVFKVTRR